MSSLPPTLPSPLPNQATVTIHALSSGSLTLPLNMFISPCPPTERQTVPSLSFLIQHTSLTTGVLTRLVFDLGLRRDLGRYPKLLQQHLESRYPLETVPDVSESLRAGGRGIGTEGVDFVVLSHVHWDHVGTPTDFQTSTFIVGHGATQLLKDDDDTATHGSHHHFESDLLPHDRTIELPHPLEENTRSATNGTISRKYRSEKKLPNTTWAPLAHFPHAIDVFSDGSLYIINAPGHLEGHINVLARTVPTKWVYLAGDAAHDRRLLTREAAVAEWIGVAGQRCCIHSNKAVAEETIAKIGMLENIEGHEVEVILAHDREWLAKKENTARFWPGKL